MKNEKRFLIVEDDKQIRSFIRFSLENQQYETICAATGSEALNAISQKMPDVVILDLGLPDMDGVDIIRRVRSYSLVPIIVVSARDQDKEKTDALDAGADDYLTKPFSINELMARIRVILRHSNQAAPSAYEPYRNGELVIDSDKHVVFMNGAEIHFTPMEFNILFLLAKNPGKVLTYSYILRSVWGSYLDSDAQSLRVFMANIRRKLKEDPANPRYIITEVGIGYRMADVP